MTDQNAVDAFVEHLDGCDVCMSLDDSDVCPEGEELWQKIDLSYWG